MLMDQWGVTSMLQARDDGGTDKERGGMKKPLEYRFAMIFKTNKTGQIWKSEKSWFTWWVEKLLPERGSVRGTAGLWGVVKAVGIIMGMLRQRCVPASQWTSIWWDCIIA